jgi:UDP-N-acetylmuramate--alanine ligase
MSSMAEILAAWGFRVTGSDSQSGETLARLKAQGIKVEVGHRASNVGEANAVIHSSAVPADNPELVEARKKGIPVVRRAEMLGEILRGKYSLAVAGTHGKTTTTTMLGRIWLHAGKDPTLLAGGTTRGENLSAVAGQGQVFIFEADEFDRSFLAMRPTSAIINNIDSDHLDCYGTLEAVREAFVTFAKSLPFYGLLVLNRDDAGVQAILPKLGSSHRMVTYGQSADSDYRATGVRADGQGMAFALERKGAKLGDIAIRTPGLHNVYNALAAAALSLEEGLSFKEVERGLNEFQGVKRRLEFRGNKGGVAFYDDYAHHPTEVAAALQAARTLGTGRLIAVFQPHLYSRTRQLFREFAEAFRNCDELFVTRVYAAREFPIDGVEGNLITDAAKAGILAADKVNYVADPDTLPERIAPMLKSGDVVVTMGAGDIGARCAYIMEAVA